MLTEGTENEGFPFFYFNSREGKVVSINAINPQKERRYSATHSQTRHRTSLGVYVYLQEGTLVILV